MKRERKNKVICWWSGGVTSAVACKLAIDLFGSKHCKIIFIDTMNEHKDTYRFKNDCELWYDTKIHTITGIGEEYPSIQDVWIKNGSLNVASGAICSTTLKRRVREKWQTTNTFKYQVFGFEFEKKEFARALSMTINYPRIHPIFPLLMFGMSKSDCLRTLQKEGIKIPVPYTLGFSNNNCLKTGCVQGGVGYWKKIQKEYPKKFQKMAEMEHLLSEKQKAPITILKDQSKDAMRSGKFLVFLLKNPKYPDYKSLGDLPNEELKPLMDCNGFCGLNDLNYK